MSRRISRGAFNQYLSALAEGDPYAIGFTIAAAILLGVVGVVWVIDRRAQAKGSGVYRRPRP